MVHFPVMVALQRAVFPPVSVVCLAFSQSLVLNSVAVLAQTALDQYRFKPNYFSDLFVNKR